MTILQLLLDIVNYKVQGKCYLFFFFFFPSAGFQAVGLLWHVSSIFSALHIHKNEF